MELLKEGSIKFFAEKSSKPLKSSAFYNPKMTMNRDLSVAVSRVFFKNRKAKVCEPLAASGVRGLRYAKELENTEVLMSDIKQSAFETMKKNVSLNKCINVKILREDANKVLSEGRFDFVDIDPFGTPAPFLTNAIGALKNNSLLGITATDMPALCGIEKEIAKRNYNAVSSRTEYCHETGTRIIIGACAKIAEKHKKVVEPLLVLSAEHYLRIFLKITRSLDSHKQQANIGYILHCFNCGFRKASKKIEKNCTACGAQLEVAGPLWIRKILKKEFCESVKEKVLNSEFETKPRLLKILQTICEEADMPATYYNVHELFRGRECLKIEELIKKLRSKGYKATRTHFLHTGIRTNAPMKAMKKLFK